MTFLETLLQEALVLFQREGIDTLSEQDIMTRLDISKATYNEFFPNKNSLVKQVIKFDHEQQKQEHQRIAQASANAVEEILTLLSNGIRDLKQVNPQYLADLMTNYPEAWDLGMHYLYDYTYHHLYEIMNKGVVAGLFRKDINIAIVVKIMLEQLTMIVNPAIFQPDRYSLSEVFRSFYLYYIRGLCTEQGSKVADSFFAQQQLE